jgi:hypothetical protein
MRNRPLLVIAALGALLSPAHGQSIDIEILDRISVGIPRAEARALLGTPSQVAKLDPGLVSEVYRLNGTEDGLRATALLYDASGRLVGHQLVFEGTPGSTLTELLLERDYQTLAQARGDQTWQLSGYDDDTGRAQIVDVSEQSAYTVVTIFERRFHADHAR